MEPIQITPHMLVTFLNIPFRGVKGEEARTHISKFKNLCENYGINRIDSEEVMLRCFRLTLQDEAREWEKNLPEIIKLSWVRLSWKFILDFEEKLEEEKIARAKIERIEEVRMVKERDETEITLFSILAKAKQFIRKVEEERRESENRRAKEINCITYNKIYSDGNNNNYNSQNNNKNREIEFKSNSYYRNPNLIRESQSPNLILTPHKETSSIKALNPESINKEAPPTEKFTNSRHETKEPSFKKLATKVSRMEGKLVEEQPREEKPSRTEPPPQPDASPAAAEPDGETTARHPDAPPLSAEDAWEVAARIRYPPPEPLPGSFSSSRFPGWYNDSWGSALYQKGIPCAGISLEKKEEFSTTEKGVDLDWETEVEEEGPEEEIDKENEKAKEFEHETWFSKAMKEKFREDYEKSLNLPGMPLHKVTLDEENNMRSDRIAFNIEVLHNERRPDAKPGEEMEAVIVKWQGNKHNRRNTNNMA